ncbi:MAG: hypothetical protein Q9216_000427 [Gyalolechia sp. 2 TL-2023]
MRQFSLCAFHLLLVALILVPSTSARLGIYPSGFPTCVNNSAELNDVTVQPYCDNAISTVCGTVAEALARSSDLSNYRATGIPPPLGRGSCEVYILFSESQPAFDFNYSICVEAFQSITIDCMLIGYGRHAGKGHQSGVRGVLYNSEGTDNSSTNPVFAALEPTNPGYIVGPPGSYGLISAVDLTEDVPGNAIIQHA